MPSLTRSGSYTVKKQTTTLNSLPLVNCLNLPGVQSRVVDPKVIFGTDESLTI